MPIRYRTRHLCPDAATARARVLAGAAHLDAVAPGWDGVIDTEILDIGRARRCVLGQLTAAGWTVLTSPFRVVERGLSIGIVNELFNMVGLRPRIVHESYARLNVAWVEFITVRRGLAEPAPSTAVGVEPARPAVAC